MCIANQKEVWGTSSEVGDTCTWLGGVWLSSSEVAIMATTDTITDDYTDDKPPPPPATKADSCVTSVPRIPPGSVLGGDRPGQTRLRP